MAVCEIVCDSTDLGTIPDSKFEVRSFVHTKSRFWSLFNTLQYWELFPAGDENKRRGIAKQLEAYCKTPEGALEQVIYWEEEVKIWAGRDDISGADYKFKRAQNRLSEALQNLENASSLNI